MLNGRDAVRWLGIILVATLVPASAQEKKRESFMATVVQTANMRLPGGGTFQR